MIELLNLTAGAQPPLPAGTAVVHPFYKTSFLRLSGLEEAEAVLPEAYPSANSAFLIPLLQAASAGYEGEITRFYDVRTTEEYGQAAPEYALLAGAGLRRVSPLSVKGEDALPFALELAEDPLGRGETVLFCCAELYTPLDTPPLCEKRREACAFLLRACGSEGVPGGRTLLLECRRNLTREEAQAAVEQEKAVQANCRLVEGTGLIQPFAQLLLAQEGVHLLVVSRYGGRYSYLHFLKEGT